MKTSHIGVIEPTSQDSSPQDESFQPDDDRSNNPRIAYDAMQRSVRYWGLAILVVSVSFLFFPLSYRPYFLVLVFLSFLLIFYRSSFLWVVLSVYMLTETITQIFVGAGWQYLLGSVFVSAACIINYLRYNHVERSYIESKSKNGTNSQLSMDSMGRRFGILAICFGWLAPIAAYVVMILALLFGADVVNQGNIFNLAGNTLLELTTLGLSFGIASLLTKTRHRLLAIAGIFPAVLAWIWEIFSWLYVE